MSMIVQSQQIDWNCVDLDVSSKSTYSDPTNSSSNRNLTMAVLSPTTTRASENHDPSLLLFDGQQQQQLSM